MMTDNQHPLVSDYLGRLAAEAAARLPGDQADELVDDIRGHLRERIRDDATEADVRNVLDRLGTPTELVDAASGAPTTAVGHERTARAGNTREMVALALLVLSVVTAVAVPVAGLLLIVGLVLAFTSRCWNGTDKSLATVVYTLLGMPLLVLGGLAAFTTSATTVCTQTDTRAGVTVREVCSGSGTSIPSWVIIPVALVVLALHVYTAVRLYRHARAGETHG